MKELNLFCFGFGQVAKNFLTKIKSNNISLKLVVTTREKSKQDNFENIIYEKLQFNENYFDQLIIEKLKKADHVLISIPPVNNEDIVIKNFKSLIANSKTKWITYLSATSVYGDHKGEWVNEQSTTNPTNINGMNRLKAENCWMKLAKENDLPLQIFRLSGIYSNESNILLRIKSGEVKLINKKNQFFSRIHVEDIANILCNSLNNFKKNEIFNISDDKPASAEEVAMYGVKLLGASKPRTIEINEVNSEMLKGFYKDSKKVNNKKMKEIFDYELKYPTYIEGLNDIHNNFI